MPQRRRGDDSKGTEAKLKVRWSKMQGRLDRDELNDAEVAALRQVPGAAGMVKKQSLSERLAADIIE